MSDNADMSLRAQLARIEKAQEDRDRVLARRIADALYDEDVVLATAAEGELDRQGATWAIKDALASVRGLEADEAGPAAADTGPTGPHDSCTPTRPCSTACPAGAPRQSRTAP